MKTPAQVSPAPSGFRTTLLLLPRSDEADRIDFAPLPRGWFGISNKPGAWFWLPFRFPFVYFEFAFAFAFECPPMIFERDDWCAWDIAWLEGSVSFKSKRLVGLGRLLPSGVGVELTELKQSSSNSMSCFKSGRVRRWIVFRNTSNKKDGSGPSVMARSWRE